MTHITAFIGIHGLEAVENIALPRIAAALDQISDYQQRLNDRISALEKASKPSSTDSVWNANTGNIASGGITPSMRFNANLSDAERARLAFDANKMATEPLKVVTPADKPADNTAAIEALKQADNAIQKAIAHFSRTAKENK